MKSIPLDTGGKMQNPFNQYKVNQTATGKKKKIKNKNRPRPKKRLKKAARKNKQTISPALLCLCGIGLTGSLFIFSNTKKAVDFIQRIEVDFSSVQAQDQANNSANEKAKEEKSAVLPVGGVSSQGSDVSNLTMRNVSVFEALKTKRLALEKKERDLARLEEDLHKQKAEIEKQLKELNKMRRNISSVLDKKVETDESSLQKLVGVYSNMKPQNAATIITQLDEELAIQVLGQMRKQNAAAILNFIEPKKAKYLSEKYAGLKTN